MSNRNAGGLGSAPVTIEQIVARLALMGDLRQFVIDDLTPDEEDRFFAILGDA